MLDAFLKKWHLTLLDQIIPHAFILINTTVIYKTAYFIMYI